MAKKEFSRIMVSLLTNALDVCQLSLSFRGKSEGLGFPTVVLIWGLGYLIGDHCILITLCEGRQ